MKRNGKAFVSVVVLAVGVMTFARKENSTAQPPFLTVNVNEKATLPCPKFQEAQQMDGAYDIIYWQKCKLKRGCDYEGAWYWMAGMNGQGKAKSTRKGVSINSDGALCIDNVRLTDVGKYMCVVKRINFTSPLRHFVDLAIDKNGSRNFTTTPTRAKGPKPQDDESIKGKGKSGELHELSTVQSWALTGKILVAVFVVSIAINLILARTSLKKCCLGLFENISGLFRSQNEVISSDDVDHQNPTFEVRVCDGEEKRNTKENRPGTYAGEENPLQDIM